MQQRELGIISVIAIYIGPPLVLAVFVPVAMALRWPSVAAIGCAASAAVVLRLWWYRHLLWLPVLVASAVEFTWAIAVLVRHAAA